MDFQAAHPQLLLSHRSIPHGIQHLKVGVPLETADLQGGGVVGIPESLRIFRGQRLMLVWFVWLVWLVFVGWLVCLVWFGLVWFGWWNSHFWQFWPWKDVCCWVCFDGYFKEWFVFWRNFGRLPFHSFKLRGYATHEKWFKEEKLHSRLFCKILVTFFVKVSINLQKETRNHASQVQQPGFIPHSFRSFFLKVKTNRKSQISFSFVPVNSFKFVNGTSFSNKRSTKSSLIDWFHHLPPFTPVSPHRFNKIRVLTQAGHKHHGQKGQGNERQGQAEVKPQFWPSRKSPVPSCPHPTVSLESCLEGQYIWRKIRTFWKDSAPANFRSKRWQRPIGQDCYIYI